TLMSNYLIKRSGSQYEIVAALRRRGGGGGWESGCRTKPGQARARGWEGPVSAVGRLMHRRGAASAARARSAQQRLGRRLVGDEAVDEPAADGGGDAAQLAAVLGRGDDVRAGALGYGGARHPFVVDAFGEPPLGIQGPADDLA